MRVIGRSFPVCAVVLAAVSAGLFAAQQEPLPASATGTDSTLARLASALSRNDGVGALAAFDSGMKGYGDVEARIEALTAQTEVLCAIDVIDEKKSDDLASLDTDWYLQLKSLADGGPTERRRERVRIQMKKFREKWKIISIDPIGILDPIHIPLR